MLTKLILNLDAIRSSLEYFESRCGGPGRVIPVLKCNGYEMGAAQIASALVGTDVSAACVANVDEGVALRNASYDIDLLVFAPIASYHDDAIEACIEHNLQPTLGSPAGLKRFELACQKAPALRGQLNLDIRISRYGWRATPQEVQEMNLENVMGNLSGAYSHVPFHSNASRMTDAISDFKANSATFNVPRHVASTMVAVNLPTDVLSQFEVNGQVAKQVGRITMDSCMLDVTGLSTVSVGDSVKLLDHEGECSTADDWCDAMNCSPWELLVALGKSNSIEYVEADQGKVLTRNQAGLTSDTGRMA